VYVHNGGRDAASPTKAERGETQGAVPACSLVRTPDLPRQGGGRGSGGHSHHVCCTGLPRAHACKAKVVPVLLSQLPARCHAHAPTFTHAPHARQAQHTPFMYSTAPSSAMTLARAYSRRPRLEMVSTRRKYLGTHNARTQAHTQARAHTRARTCSCGTVGRRSRGHATRARLAQERRTPAAAHATQSHCSHVPHARRPGAPAPHGTHVVIMRFVGSPPMYAGTVVNVSVSPYPKGPRPDGHGARSTNPVSRHLVWAGGAGEWGAWR
jgi:hypothetical protein